MYLPKVIKDAIDESIKIASNKVLSKVYTKLISKRPHVKDLIDFKCDDVYREDVIGDPLTFNTIRDFLDHDPICRGIKGGNIKKGFYTRGCYCMAPKQEGCGDYCSNHKNQNTSMVNGQDTNKIVLTNLKTYVEDNSRNRIEDNPFNFL